MCDPTFFLLLQGGGLGQPHREWPQEASPKPIRLVKAGQKHPEVGNGERLLEGSKWVGCCGFQQHPWEFHLLRQSAMVTLVCAVRVGGPVGKGDELLCPSPGCLVVCVCMRLCASVYVCVHEHICVL